MEIKLNSDIYPLESILNTCYVFLERAYIFLDASIDGRQINVSIKSKKKISPRALVSLRGEFMNELLHCALRYKISKNNKRLREYIVGRALYASSALTEAPKENLSSGDPLGIAVPWEDKYGKKSKKNARAKV